jgi:hypothetical protein
MNIRGTPTALTTTKNEVEVLKQHRAYAPIQPAASPGLQPGPTVETR